MRRFIKTEPISKEYIVYEINFLKGRYRDHERFAILCQLDGESASRVIEFPYQDVSVEYRDGIDTPKMTVERTNMVPALWLNYCTLSIAKLVCDVRSDMTQRVKLTLPKGYGKILKSPDSEG